MAQDKLIAFVGRALANGESRERIVHRLSERGWRSNEITGVLDLYEDLRLPLTVPRRDRGEHMKERLIFFLFFVGIYLGSMVLLMILHDLTSIAMPDLKRYGAYIATEVDGALRRGIAVLLVFFPFYLLLVAGVLSALFAWTEIRWMRAAERTAQGSI